LSESSGQHESEILEEIIAFRRRVRNVTPDARPRVRSVERSEI